MQQDKLAAASLRQYAQDQRPVCKLLGRHIRAMRQQRAMGWWNGSLVLCTQAIEHMCS